MTQLNPILDQGNGSAFVSLADIARYCSSATYRDELLVFDSFNIHWSATLPVRINGLLLCMCTEGSGIITIDLKRYSFSENCMIVIHPNNFITTFETAPGTSLKMVVCSPGTIEHIMPKLTDLLPLMMQNHNEPVTHYDAWEARNLTSYFETIKSKMEGPETPYRRQKLICILQAAMFEMMEIQHSRTGTQTVVQRTRREEIMAKFLIQVSENFRRERQVNFYADQLCITPKHLSAVVKEISGRTAGEWIDNYVIMEAKVLLTSTDYTIQEIATMLNFPNQSFFGKYFKHHTGASPSEYRKNPAN